MRRPWGYVGLFVFMVPAWHGSGAPVGQSHPIAASDDKSLTVPYRDFLLPLTLCSSARGSEIKSIILHVSTDRGRTWKKVGTIGPDEKGWEFHATSDGDHWFTLQVVQYDGVLKPKRIPEEGATVMKVRIDAKRRTTTAKPSDSGTELYKMPHKPTYTAPKRWYRMPYAD